MPNFVESLCQFDKSRRKDYSELSGSSVIIEEESSTFYEKDVLSTDSSTTESVCTDTADIVVFLW